MHPPTSFGLPPMPLPAAVNAALADCPPAHRSVRWCTSVVIRRPFPSPSPCPSPSVWPTKLEFRGGPVIISSVSPGLGRGRLRAVYAIIRTGGKQYRVTQGDTIYVERLEAPVGEKVTLGEVLFVAGEKDETKVGAPLIDKASVAATVLDLGRDHKIRVFKYKKRKHYRRTRGHRQSYTALRIDSISL